MIERPLVHTHRARRGAQTARRIAHATSRARARSTSSFSLIFAAALIAFLFCAPSSSRAQTGGGGQTLYGDLKVDEGRAEGMKPLTFDVILYYLDGRVFGRQRVSSGGRYRFFGLRTGEYDLSVELDTQEVARLRVSVGAAAVTGSDTQRDIELEFKPNPAAPRAPARKQTVSAEDFYDRPAANQPTFKRAQEAVDKKSYEQAAALFKQIVAADDKDFQAWTELGTVYLLLKKDGDAERAYESAISARPGFFLAHFNLGRARVGRKKFAEAVEPLARAVELQPTSAEANFQLGEAYLQIKQGSKAVGYLEAAGRLGKAEAHFRLATLYNAVGLKDRAAAEYEQFLAKNPDYPDKKKLQQYIAENKKK